MAGRQSSRRRLATVLVSVGTISVILLVSVVTLMARFLLDNAATAQLESVRDGRQAAVERGVEELQSSLAAMAADPGLVTAATDLADAWPPRDLADSDYTAAYAEHDPFLRELLDSADGTDLLVVAADTNDVVYSATGDGDAAERAAQWEEAGLSALVDRLPDVPVGDAVIVDGPVLESADGTRTAVVAATIRSGAEVIGALVMPVSAQHLTDLVSGDGNWDQLGLGNSGDAAVVGADGTLRTEPRTWIEDPQDYLDRLAATGEGGEEQAAAIEAAGSPVLVQAIANPVIAAAVGGEEIVDTVSGVLQDRTRATAAMVESGGLGWVVVATHSSSDALNTIWAFVRWVGLLLALVVPLIMLAAFLLSRALTRPIPSLVAVSSELAAGNLDVVVPDLGRNEFGDLATQLGAVAVELRRQRGAVEAEEQRIQGILSAVVPARLMDRVRGGERGFSDVLETATVVSVTLMGLPDPSGAEQDIVLEATSRIMIDLEELAARCDVEAVRAAARHELFLAGLGGPDPDVDVAAAFAVQVQETVHAAGREFGLDVDASVGMAAGTIGTGLIGSTQVAFGVWGDPPGRAAALNSLARAGEVLVDGDVAMALGAAWTTHPVEDAVGLSDDDLDAHVMTASMTASATAD